MVQDLDPNATWPCPRCKVPQAVSAKFCANCGQPLGAAEVPQPAAPPQVTRQDLAAQAVSSAHWGCTIQLFALGGLALGFLVGLWVMANTDLSLRILAPVILPLVGAYIGWRLALSMWASGR